MKLYLSLILVFSSFMACSTGGVTYKQKEDLPKNAVFYSDEDKFKIPLCILEHSLYRIKSGWGLKCENLPHEISNNIGELGTVIGEIKLKVDWHGDNRAVDFYIIKDKNIGYVFAEKNYYDNNKLIKIKQSPYQTVITGGSNGLVIDIDLYNARIRRDGIILFLITLKNTSDKNIIFNSATDKVSLSYGNQKNRFKRELFPCNFCSPVTRDFEKILLPKEEKIYFAKVMVEYEDEDTNIMLGIQMGIKFTKIMIDGLTEEKNKLEPADIKKYEKTLNKTWGGFFTSSKNNITIPLEAQIKPILSGK